MNIKLREAEKKDEKQVIEMYEEYINSELVPGMDIFEGIRDFEKLENLNFEEWLDDLEKNKDEENLPKDYSTHTLFLAFNEEEKIVGAIGIRWQEVPVLITHGGFIGYSVRPSERNKGYATEMLKLGLKEAKNIWKGKILITCKDFNIPSKKVIEKNCGIFENEYINKEDGYTYLRYWINLE